MKDSTGMGSETSGEPVSHVPIGASVWYWRNGSPRSPISRLAPPMVPESSSIGRSYPGIGISGAWPEYIDCRPSARPACTQASPRFLAAFSHASQQAKRQAPTANPIGRPREASSR
ncbi:MAG: hypothetical protein EBU81_02900 [Proteobacteria bacterium]|nr:hypothetical protein [Pseudomonadota bacterium]